MRPSIKKYGDLVTTTIVFDKAGDVLPMHTHTKENAHITIVTKGECLMCGPTFETKHVKAGELVDWDEDIAHEFKAAVDDTVIISIVKNLNIRGVL